MADEERNPYEIYEKARTAMMKLEIKRGDVAVIYFPKDIDPLQMHAAAEHLGLAAEEMGATILCLRFGMTVEHLPEEEMNKLGWYRRDDES